MPSFFSLSQLHDAITARAVPTLEQLANNPNHLDNSLNNRFDRNDPPPPYVSSSESEEEEALHHPVLARSQEAVLEEFKGLISKPLNDLEFRSVVETLHSIGIYTPGDRYGDEAEREHDRLSRFYRSANSNSHADDILAGPRGYQRRNVIVRRNIRKRWKRLGVWNSEWGIPGRVNRQSNDNLRSWRWKWQSTADPPPSDPRHPISRAVQLRRNLAYGEHTPPPPRSRLRDDSSASEAESFILSRPWFVFEVDKLEFMRRYHRIPVEQLGRSSPDEDGQVTKWWKERGDWMPGWKWRHESPSPEPEDLTPLSTDDMDFTPSEVDALEAIPLLSPKPRLAQTDSPPKWGLFSGSWHVGFKPADAPQNARSGAADEPRDQLMQEAEEHSTNTPPRRRGRQRKQSQPTEFAAAPPPPRRSARIAARNANALPPTPPVTAQRRRAGMPRGPPAVVRLGNAPSAADAPKRRGRPRKTHDGAITKSAAPTSKRGRSGRAAAVAAAAAAGAVDGKVTKGAASGLRTG